MGSMQFLLPRREGLAELAVNCAYMIGNDGAPWETHVTYHSGRLTVSRDARESGRLIAPWTIAGCGQVALSTATLLPRDTPYHLVLELCRGTLSRILSQFAPSFLDQPAVHGAVSEAERHFVTAALSQHDIERCAREAEASLAICVNLIRKCLAPALKAQGPSNVCSRLTGFQIDSPRGLNSLLQSSRTLGNAVFYQSSWRETESNPGEFNWATWQRDLRRIRQSKRRAACGPLFRLNRHDLPDWLYLWEEDFDTLQSYVVNYVQKAVDALRGDVNLWYVTAGTNIESELQLGEEHRLRLTLSAIEALRRADSQTPALVGIRQPWGEYLGHAAIDLSPWQFADIVVRSELGISGFVLEMNIACTSDRTLPRDLLELNRLIDHWSTFGLPLVIHLAIATPGKAPVLGQPSGISTQTVQTVRDIVALLIQKPSVQGIIWGQFYDRADWKAGVITADGTPKAVLQTLADCWCRNNDT
ncbi:MAG: hypothetical protein KDA92_12115 [Planctomycetales bacterium]|nr:hypothetical protein [Planctomycetales bacterium]